MTTPPVTGQSPLDGINAHVDAQDRLVLRPPVPVIFIPGHIASEDIKVELGPLGVTITITKVG